MIWLTRTAVDPDRSNPTRNRWERPLDTIRSFEAAIDGSYARRSYRMNGALGWLSGYRYMLSLLTFCQILRMLSTVIAVEAATIKVRVDKTNPYSWNSKPGKDRYFQPFSWLLVPLAHMKGQLQAESSLPQRIARWGRIMPADLSCCGLLHEITGEG